MPAKAHRGPLLEAMARAGTGDHDVHLPGTSVAAMAERLTTRMVHTPLTEIAIDWGGAEIRDVYPMQLPDLHVGQTLRVFGRVEGSPDGGPVRVRGRVGDQVVTASWEGRAMARGAPVRLAWAQQDIHALMAGGQVEAATKRSLEHWLVSPTTALVAVSKHPSTCGTDARQPISVPSARPAGMSQTATFQKLPRSKRTESISRLENLLGRPVEAEARAEVALRLGMLYLQEAQSQSRPEVGQQAARLFQWVLDLHPRYARRDQAWFGLGRALALLGKRDQALDAWEALLAQHPGSSWIAEGPPL